VFEGEKTGLFWAGLVILGFASVTLFGILWSFAISNAYGDRFTTLKYQVPTIVDGVVFILIGFYMMRSGVKKKSQG